MVTISLSASCSLAEEAVGRLRAVSSLVPGQKTTLLLMRKKTTNHVFI
jgi:hypothetical protein